MTFKITYIPHPQIFLSRNQRPLILPNLSQNRLPQCKCCLVATAGTIHCFHLIHNISLPQGYWRRYESTEVRYLYIKLGYKDANVNLNSLTVSGFSKIQYNRLESSHNANLKSTSSLKDDYTIKPFINRLIGGRGCLLTKIVR